MEEEKQEDPVGEPEALAQDNGNHKDPKDLTEVEPNGDAEVTPVDEEEPAEEPEPEVNDDDDAEDEKKKKKKIAMKVSADAPWSEWMWEVFTTFWPLGLVRLKNLTTVFA